MGNWYSAAAVKFQPRGAPTLTFICGERLNAEKGAPEARPDIEGMTCMTIGCHVCPHVTDTRSHANRT